MKAKWIILLLLLATNVSAQDCTNDGEYSWTTCYGLEHGIIELATIKGVDLLEEPLGLPNHASRIAGGAACTAFIVREWRLSGGPFHDADRALDWIVPCAIGILYDPGRDRQIGFTNSIGGKPVDVGLVFSLDF